MKRNTFKKLYTIFLPIVVICIFILFPYLWTFITSLRQDSELNTKIFHLLPVHPTFSNYQYVLGEASFMRGLFNSAIVAISTSVLTLVISLMASYACSRYHFRGRNTTMTGFLLIHMFPPVLLLMPLFVMMKNLSLINTYPSLIIAYCTFTIPFSIWLLTGYLNDIPIELEEAAIVDGCNRITAFIKVIFPLAAPGMVAATVYIFIYSWNEFLFATMFTSQNIRTVPVVIYSFIGEHVISWGLLTSSGILTGLPVIILFMLIQNKLVEGLTAGAVKG